MHEKGSKPVIVLRADLDFLKFQTHCPKGFISAEGYERQR